MNVEIKTLWDFNRCMLDIGPHVWPGGYPTYFITSDGCALSFETAKKEGRLIRDALIENDVRSGWHVCGMSVNWENPELFCEHSGLRIESAYAEDQANENAAFTPEELDRFRLAYEECALWSSLNYLDDEDSDGESLEGYETSLDCYNAMLRDCRDFTDANAADLRDAFNSSFTYSVEHAGHDFWLTRNGHGAGFWDRGLGKIGERLTEASKAYGEVNLYVDDETGEVNC